MELCLLSAESVNIKLVCVGVTVLYVAFQVFEHGHSFASMCLILDHSSTLAIDDSVHLVDRRAWLALDDFIARRDPVAHQRGHVFLPLAENFIIVDELCDDRHAVSLRIVFILVILMRVVVFTHRPASCTYRVHLMVRVSVLRRLLRAERRLDRVYEILDLLLISCVFLAQCRVLNFVKHVLFMLLQLANLLNFARLRAGRLEVRLVVHVAGMQSAVDLHRRVVGHACTSMLLLLVALATTFRVAVVSAFHDLLRLLSDALAASGAAVRLGFGHDGSVWKFLADVNLRTL